MRKLKEYLDLPEKLKILELQIEEKILGNKKNDEGYDPFGFLSGWILYPYFGYTKSLKVRVEELENELQMLKEYLGVYVQTTESKTKLAKFKKKGKKKND